MVTLNREIEIEMKAAQLLELAQELAAVPANIQNGLVNWDWVQWDVNLQLSARCFKENIPQGEDGVDRQMVKDALYAAAALIEPNRVIVISDPWG